MAKAKQKKSKSVAYEQALDMLPAADQRVAAASLDYTEAYEAALAAFARCSDVVREKSGELAGARKYRDQLRAVIEKGEGNRIVVSEMVDNPMMTNGLREEDDGPVPASISAAKNLAILIGGLSKVDGRTDAQTAAAAKFRLMHERAQLGGARAIDYGVVRVDTSGRQGDLIEEIGAQARSEYASTVQAIGITKASLIERVVIYDHSIRDIAMSMFKSDSGGARKQAKRALFEALNSLAECLGTAPAKQVKGKPRRWSDGTKLKLPSQIEDDIAV